MYSSFAASPPGFWFDINGSLRRSTDRSQKASRPTVFVRASYGIRRSIPGPTSLAEAPPPARGGDVPSHEIPSRGHAAEDLLSAELFNNVRANFANAAKDRPGAHGIL